MARNQRRRAQEALFSPAPSTTPPEEEKAAERTESPLTGDKTCDRALVGYFRDQMNDREAGMALSAKVGVLGSPADIIREEYGIEPNCTNVPRLLYAILCEVARGRV